MLKRNDDGQAASAFYDKRRRWLDYLCELDGVSDRAFRIGFWLAKRMNGEDQCCWHQHATIAKALDVSVDTVARAIADLETRGVLIVVREHRKPNTYYIRLPFD